MPRKGHKTGEEAAKSMTEAEKDYVAHMVLAVVRAIFYAQQEWR